MVDMPLNKETKPKSSFAKFGIPQIVISSEGLEFKSNHFNTFSKQLDIKHIITSPNYSQSNGVVEKTI